MILECLDNSVILKDEILYIKPYIYEIPIYQIREFAVMDPCLHVNGLVQITLYDFSEYNRHFFMFPFFGQEKVEIAHKIADSIHNYDFKIENSIAFKFLKGMDFEKLRDKEAYLKHMILENNKRETEDSY